jgi:O-antigen/teichoic acid export membrane protein
LLAQIKRLSGDSLLYALMNVGTKLIAFLMIPIYTAYLGLAEMGVLENIDALTSILTFVVIFGTDNALAFYYFDTKEEKEKEEYVKTVLLFRILISVLIFILFLIFGKWISILLTNSEQYVDIILLSGLVLVLEAVATVILTYFRFEFKSLKVVIYTVTKLGMVALLSYIFLRFFSANVEAVFYGRIISTALIVMMLTKPLKTFITFKFNKELMKKILVYGAPLVPASVAFWVITFSNRFFLTKLESLEEVGIYAVAVKFAAVIALLTSSVQMAWRPYTMSIKDREDAPRLFSKLYLLILIIGLSGLLGIATVIPYILSFMVSNESFEPAADYIAFLSLGTFLSFYYLIISVGLFIKKDTKIIAYYVGISAIICVVLNILLIPLFSIWGAVAAMLIPYLFVNISIFLRSQKVYFVPVPVFKMIFLFINGVAAMGAVVFIQTSSAIHTGWLIIPWLYFIVVVLISGIFKELRK